MSISKKPNQPNTMKTTKNPAAVALGSIRTDKKSAASRENGKMGGRPKGRANAIRTARKMVSELQPLGNGWYYESYRADLNAWYQHQARPYHAAKSARAQSLIDAALAALGRPDACVVYDGGSWMDYVP